MLTMAITALATVLHNLRRSLLRQDEAGFTDGELLECFITRRDEAAFEALLGRHGQMGLGVCRRVLRNEADAEDAFPATFLVLVRKAGSIQPRSMVGNWLYGVAHSTALKARAMSTK
jgi:DNA-directed RNA polymerase specialized sigma24 family protein